MQRTKEGLESARARGRKGGRPKVKERNVEKALKLYNSKKYSISEIVKMFGSQATLYRYIQKQGNSLENTINPTNEKITQILMSLRVENNNKFVRGKKKARENIERYLKYYYKMQKSSSSDDDYIIFVKYKDIDDLKNTVYEIFRELENEADAKNCFTEGDASCDELNLNWLIIVHVMGTSVPLLHNPQ